MASTLAHDYTPPTSPGGVTFVGCNALTSERELWEVQLGARLRAAGHGTLWWNYRAQSGSEAAPELRLDDARHAGDLLDLLDTVQPPRPVPVGLSIGGLFAARAFLDARATTPAFAGLALLNTLRKPGPRLDWINDAVYNAARFGGSALIGDMLAPMLFHSDWLVANRANALQGNYAPLAADAGPCRLLGDARASDWDLPWELLDVPVLVATGLHDRVFRIDEDIAELTARLPQPTRVGFERAGHMLPVEAPEELGRALLDWAASALG